MGLRQPTPSGRVVRWGRRVSRLGRTGPGGVVGWGLGDFWLGPAGSGRDGRPGRWAVGSMDGGTAGLLGRVVSLWIGGWRTWAGSGAGGCVVQ